MQVEQALVKQIVATVEEEYLADIYNSTTKPINATMADVLTHLQENYDQLIPQKILKDEEIFKKTTYHPRDPIATVFYDFEEILEFDNITGMSYTQQRSLKIVYVIINKTIKFGQKFASGIVCQQSRRRG